ncbi:MAG: SMI1/KNR4 family protein [Pedobacter sp.]|nr:MAG: SMI1/KNR4 family protein [Pedobacter sp.]
MINKEKLIELSKQYPKDIVMYNQDVKTLMKLPGRIPGEFDAQLLEFLQMTNGALILDYRFYGFKNILFNPSLDQNLKDKWYEWQHIAGNVVPFLGSSSSFGFGYLCNANIENTHPIVYFTEFPEDTTLVASSFELFFNEFLRLVELTLNKGNNVEIDEDDWPFNNYKLGQSDKLLQELKLSKAYNIIETIRGS